MSFSAAKSSLILFLVRPLKGGSPPFEIFFDGFPVQRVQSHELLGVTLDQRNNGVAQCKNILQCTTGPVMPSVA